MRKKLFMIISLVTFYCLFSCYSQTFEIVSKLVRNFVPEKSHKSIMLR